MATRNKKKLEKPLLRLNKSNKYKRLFWLLDEEEEKEDNLFAVKSRANSAQNKEQTLDLEGFGVSQIDTQATVHNGVASTGELESYYFSAGSDLNLEYYVGSDIDPANFGHYLDPMEYIRYFQDSIKRAHFHEKPELLQHSSSVSKAHSPPRHR